MEDDLSKMFKEAQKNDDKSKALEPTPDKAKKEQNKGVDGRAGPGS